MAKTTSSELTVPENGWISVGGEAAMGPGWADGGCGEACWSLRYTSTEAPLRHLRPEWLYRAPVPRTKLTSPAPAARFSGLLEITGSRPIELEGWPGMVGHNWGRHTEQYVWGHCNAWDDGDDVVLEGGGGRTRVGGLLLPFRTVLAVRHHGTAYRMSDLASVARNESDVTTRRWRFRGRGPRVEVEGEMWAETDDLVGLFYPNPDGHTIHCLNSKIAHAEVTLRLAGRAPRKLTSARAALEIGTPDPSHGVRMHV